MPERYSTVVIGTSAGGMNALTSILSKLTDKFIPTIIIVQHIQEEGTDGYRTTFLNKKCALPVEDAIDKTPIQPGTVYLAPPAYHLLLEESGTLSLSIDEPVNYSRPSIDVLFESAAVAFKEKLIGIILTGANNDGEAGLKKIKQMGGYTIVQDPDEAEAKAMPLAAIKGTEVDQVLPLEQIGRFLAKLGTPTINTNSKQPHK